MDTERHAPGAFSWAELATTDAAGAKRFYGALFGWEPDDQPMGPDQFYTMLKLRGRHAGALYPMGQERSSRGEPPHWSTYVAVESADATAKKARELGATVMMDPFDVFEAGRMAVITDPTGAAVCLWEAKKHPGFGLWGEPGAVCWCELATRDVARARAFYSELFGWTTQLSPEYTQIELQGRPIGGMMQIRPEWGDVPPHWLVYIEVPDCDAAVKKATGEGGATVVPPMDIPSGGRFSVLRDPQGAVFAVYKSTR